VCRRRELNEIEYHKAVNQSLYTLVEDLEDYFDSVRSSTDVEIQYSVIGPLQISGCIVVARGDESADGIQGRFM